MYLNKFLQENYNTLPPLLQDGMAYLQGIASKFNLKIVNLGSWYYLEDTANFFKSYLELMKFDELYLTLSTLAELNNI